VHRNCFLNGFYTYNSILNSKWKQFRGLDETLPNACRISSWFDVCVTMHYWYNNINSQLDATITNFIDNYNQLNMFWAIISPILRSTGLCLQLVYNAPVILPAGDKDVTSRQHRQCVIPQAVNTVQCFWGWVKLSPETCWADCNYQ